MANQTRSRTFVADVGEDMAAAPAGIQDLSFFHGICVDITDEMKRNHGAGLALQLATSNLSASLLICGNPESRRQLAHKIADEALDMLAQFTLDTGLGG